MEREGDKNQEFKEFIEKRTTFHGKMGAPLFSWPWENFGTYKYLLYVPLVANFLYSVHGVETEKNIWYLHVLILCALRGLIHQLWNTFCNMLWCNRTRRIFEQDVDFKQIDLEWHWDNFLLLQTVVGSLSYLSFPWLTNLPIWQTKGFICCLLLHVGVSEPLYYWVHKLLLHNSNLFKHYHWFHHSSKVPHPYTAGHGTFMEHLILCIIIGIPTLGTALIGYGSIITTYSYVLIFDFLRCFKYCNIEIIPYSLFQTIPFLKYLISTPTYHSLHHIEMKTNFCLFMPLYDALGKTMDSRSWNFHKEITSRSNLSTRRPEFVFLVHLVDMMSSMHAPFVFRSFNSLPFRIKPFLFPMWPLSFLSMLALWTLSKTYSTSFYNLRGRLHETWIVPRFGFQYFLPFAAQGINKIIEEAILKADRLGVRVISLAALNKNEGLNGGGTLFVNKHPDLKVRVVHGNTLTAAVILNGIPKDVNEVFITGATSKLGRAIALDLASRSIRVLMLTQSSERFMKIQNEAATNCQKFLVQVTNYQAAKQCKTWILGKWSTRFQQSCAPSGTYFHQYVVPPVIPFRRDCTYGKMAAMKLPEDVQGLGSCEYTMQRGEVAACHAGGVVHFLEGWTHHEVGAINVDQIAVVWKAALKHGLKPV